MIDLSLLIVSKSVAPLCHSFLYFSSLYFIPLSVLLARAAGRELPPAAEAREPPLAAAERAAAERMSMQLAAGRCRPCSARATAGSRGAGCC